MLTINKILAILKNNAACALQSFLRLKIISVLGIFLFLFILFLSVKIYTKRKQLAAAPQILSSWTSKSLCTCLFLQGHDEDFCRDYADRHWIPIQEINIDSKNKTVKVKALWHSNEAFFKDLKNGCSLKVYKK